jgi:hypothetical protein
MKAVLIHGLGRTSLSMTVLALRLKCAGIQPILFSYSARTESLETIQTRLSNIIKNNMNNDDYILIGHSLGSVLIRSVINLKHVQPKALFFIAPPSIACKAARYFSTFILFRWFTGDMGLKLASEHFMSSLPIPCIQTKIYAGTAGIKVAFSPFKGLQNDGILSVDEVKLNDLPVIKVRSLHTFIMNNRVVIHDIIHTSHSLSQSNR